ncbi:MAG: DNA polymerase III subunit beta [Propionibacteriaceae bacterium]|jgi:DNA polymerase-3 subunit beta|nr:DNA polymerase III subunit beta [Propionibacteriaceae bacterium]
MKIQIDKDKLADAVSWAARSLPTRPSVPILAGLMIKAEAGMVTMSSFDYETSAQVSTQAEVETPGVVLVSGKLLADITKSLPQKPVTLSSTDTELEVLCGSARFALQTLPAMDYPDLPHMPQASGWIDAEEMLKGVSQVVVAAGRDELLPVFTGVKIEFDGKNLSLLGTDRYRMALKEMTWNPSTSAQGETSVLVPGKVLLETAKSMVTSPRITISLADTAAGEGLIGFQAESNDGVRQITTRLLDGEFPQLRHLMSVSDDLSVCTDTQDLISAVRRVALVAEKNTSLRMKIGDDHVTLEAARGDQAQASEAVKAIVVHNTAEPALVDAGFNPNYLLDALQALDTPAVHFSFTGSGKPCLLTGLEKIDGEPDQDYRHVIMLMRLTP